MADRRKQLTRLSTFSQRQTNIDIITIFLTGGLAGGVTCLAVQGGLLATSIANQEDERLPVISFLTTRLIAYTILGFFLGYLGSFFQLSINARIGMQVFVVIFMIGTALNLLQIHPIFRYFVIQPPKSFARLLRDQSKSKSVFGPAILGAFTVLIPCGATQAMMAYAISTGSALQGMTTMFAFILGTTPLFYLMGYVARRAHVSGKFDFNKVAAMAIIAVAIYNLRGAANLAGLFTPKTVNAVEAQAVERASIYFTSGGYISDPETIYAKGGTTLELSLINSDGYGCVQAFTIPKLGIQKVIPVGSSEKISIPIPAMNGTIAFMCSMGMYQGTITVI